MRFSHFILGGGVLLLSIVVHAEPRNMQLLASACAACHGTNGHSQGGIPSLAGLNTHYFIQQMLEFKNGQRDGTVMMQHAAGYSEAEIRALAHFFSEQK